MRRVAVVAVAQVVVSLTPVRREVVVFVVQVVACICVDCPKLGAVRAQARMTIVYPAVLQWMPGHAQVEPPGLQ